MVNDFDFATVEYNGYTAFSKALSCRHRLWYSRFFQEEKPRMMVKANTFGFYKLIEWETSDFLFDTGIKFHLPFLLNSKENPESTIIHALLGMRFFKSELKDLPVKHIFHGHGYGDGTTPEKWFFSGVTARDLADLHKTPIFICACEDMGSRFWGSLPSGRIIYPS